MERVFADTNVLFPFSIMDLVLGMAEDGMHEFIWSNDLLDEWERVIVENNQRSAESAASIVFAIREFFEDGEIPTASYAAEVDDMPSADLDDRKHIAAAKVGRATVLLTRNLKHFPVEPLSEMSIRVLDADAYLCEQLARSSEQMLWTVSRIAGEKRRPSMTVGELVAALGNAGVPAFAERFRAEFGIV